MTRIILVLGFALLLVSHADAAKKPKAEKKEAPAAQSVCVPVAPLLEKLKESGLEFEDVTDPVAVKRIASVITANLKTPFPVPTRLIVVFIGEEAHVGFIISDKLCAALMHLPGHAVRRLLQTVHGQSVGS